MNCTRNPLLKESFDDSVRRKESTLDRHGIDMVPNEGVSKKLWRQNLCSSESQSWRREWLDLCVFYIVE